MNTALRPATLEALASFRERRKKLLLQKAAITAGVVLLSLFLIVALLDRATFMPDAVRKVLSYLGYMSAAIAAWWAGMRLVRQARDVFGAARLMERADVKMHEQLVSAVELAQTKEENIQDSPEFRARLQDDVADQLQGFKADSVLPTSLLGPWLKRLGALAALIIGLCFVPGLHLPGFMARAALPFANFSRPSSVKITIINPAKGSAIVPLASSVPLGVQIEGTKPARVIVEMTSGEGKPTRMELNAATGNLYEGSVGIGQSSVRYRVKAGDAITAWQTLDARARPRVVEFQKVITPPAYTEMPVRTVTEDHGSISALEGSTVQVILKTNQSVSQSAASLLPELTSLPVQTDKKDMLSLSIPIHGKSDSWQLALTSKETGFTNEEATPWSIETIPDLPPSVVITQPSEQLEVRSDDAVQISGQATDDVGVQQIELSFAINGADWKAEKIADKSGLEMSVTHEFKLAPLPVKNGDAVLVKLIATDGKGQKAESSPVRLFVVEEKLNLAQREWAAKQRQLAQQAATLKKETYELRKNAEKVRNHKPGDESDAALATTKQDLANVEERAKELWDDLKASAQDAPNALKSLEINLTGQRLSEMRGQHLKEMQEQSRAEQIDAKQLMQAAHRAAEDAERVEDALQAFAAADTAQAVNQALEHLAPQQNRLADKAMEANRQPAERGKWQEQQKAALAAAENARDDLQALRDVIQDGRKNDVKNQLTNLEKRLPALAAALDTEQQHQAPEFVQGQAHEMRNATNQARDASRWFAEEASQKAQEMRDRLAQQQNPALAALDQAREKAEQAVHQRKDTPNEESAQQQAADKLAAAARQFKDQSELREQSPQTNTQAALDMNRMGRALDNLAEQMKQHDSPEAIKETLTKAKELTKSARALEADATAQDARTALANAEEKVLNQMEPKEALADANAAMSQMRRLPEQLRRAEADPQASNLAQEAVNPAQWQSGELKSQAQQAAQQKQNGQPPQQLAPEQNNALKANQNAQQKLAESMEKFAPKVAAARENLEAMTPKLSELAKNTAEQLKDSQEKTAQVAQSAQNSQPAEQTAQQAQALMPQAKQDAEKLADLQAALRQEADKADLNDEAQRQMARTADVGLEQMRQQTPQIAQNLQQAANAKESPQQAQALQKAAQSQQQTAEALQKLAQNLEKMEQGQMLPQDALAAQQAMEQQLGIQQPLDESYAEAQSLAELMQQAQANPQQALSALEAELQKNPQMQRALGNLAGQAAAESKQALEQAQSQPAMTLPAAEQAAHDLGRVARHEERLGQKQAAQQVAEASKKIEQMTKATKADPAQNTPQSAQQATQSAQAASQAASEAAQAQNASVPAASSFLDVAKAAMLAQALDQLDQAVNPMQSSQAAQQAQAGQPQGQPQPSPQGQPSAQQQAQESLAQANQAQAQSMAQARAQGMVPGQKPQPGQQPGKQGQGESQQPSPDDNGNLTQGAPNTLVPVLVAGQDGDWGHLPSRMAKDLSEASRQEPSPEYREAIQSYYKAIAEKARK